MMRLMHTSRFTHSGRWLFVCILSVCSLLSTRGFAESDEILIVLSSESDPYVVAAKSCELNLRNAGIQTKRVLLSSLSNKDTKQDWRAVITIGGRASSALARELSDDVPMYYCMTPSPEKIGLTKRTRTSGISTETPFDEQILIISEGSDSLRRIGALYRSGSASSSNTVQRMRDSLPAGWELVAVDLDSVKSASQGIKDLLKKDVDLVWTTADPSVYNSSTIKALLIESIRKRVPVFGFSHSLVRAGATFGIGIDPGEQGAQAAVLAIRNAINEHLFAKPQVAVNVIVADRIRFKIPSSLLRLAEVVFRPE